MKAEDLVKGNHYTDTSYPSEIFVYNKRAGKSSPFPGDYRFDNLDPKLLGICCTPDQIETDTAPILSTDEPKS